MSVKVPSKRWALTWQATRAFDDVPGVYFLFKRRRLLYVGYGSGMGTRLRAANNRIYSHFGIIKCRDPLSALKLEAQTIYELMPPHNRLILNPTKFIPGIEQKWNASQRRFRIRFMKQMEKQAKIQKRHKARNKLWENNN